MIVILLKNADFFLDNHFIILIECMVYKT